MLECTVYGAEGKWLHAQTSAGFVVFARKTDNVQQTDTVYGIGSRTAR